MMKDKAGATEGKSNQVFQKSMYAWDFWALKFLTGVVFNKGWLN